MSHTVFAKVCRQILATVAVIVLSGGTGFAATKKFGAWLVVDAKSGQVLASHNPNRPWYPASLTKMMTAYVTFQAIKDGRITLKSPVTVSARARKQPPSKMGFKVGTLMTVDNALKMLIVKSANDIAMAIAESVGGSEANFIADMNRTAKRLGMSESHFANPHGLPNPRQIVTARDMAILARALIRDFPQHRHYFRIMALRHGRSYLRAHNPLLNRVRGTDGMKTGFICNAGLNLVATVTRNGRTMISVVLGARSGLERAVVSKMLIENAFARRPQPGRTTMAALATQHSRGSLPQNGYCKKVTRPTGEELEAMYSSKSLSATFLASAGMRYAAGDRDGHIVVPTVDRKAKRKRGKRGRRDYFTKLVGRPIHPVRPVRVFLGLPSNPKLTRSLPKPTPSPRREASGSRDSADLAVKPIDGAGDDTSEKRAGGIPFPKRAKP